MNSERLKYLVGRIKESPFKFLLRKFWILFCEKFLFYPGTPTLWLLVRINYLRILKGGHLTSPHLFDRNVFSEQSINELKILKERAENGTFECLGYGLVDIFNSGCFSKDCIHEYSWPEIHFSKIDFVCSSVTADVKIPWEKSRLQWLLHMTVYYYIENDIREKYCSILEMFQYWQAENEFLKSVNWCSSMEVAIRVINIISIYKILAPFLSKKQSELFYKSIAQHRVYLTLFPEVSDVPGNHYLATESGLLVTETIVCKNEKAFDKALERFAMVSASQFNEDGLHIEFAPMYHRLCLDIILVSYLFAVSAKSRSNNHTEKLKSIIIAGSKALKAVSSENGKIPIFGDNDSGEVYSFGQDSRCGNIYLASSISKEGIPKPQTLENFYKAFFPKAQDVLGLINHHQNSSVAYPFYSLKSGSFKLITRIGSLGLKGRGAHDHDDNLSFWLFDGDDDVVVDLGCAPYTTSIKNRESCISSSAHNLIKPENRERSKLKPGSIFKTVRGCSVASLTQSQGEIISGIMRTEEFEHHRTFKVVENGFSIVDKFNSIFDKAVLIIHFYALKMNFSIKENGMEFTSENGVRYLLVFNKMNVSSFIIEEVEGYFSYGSNKLITTITVPIEGKTEIDWAIKKAV